MDTVRNLLMVLILPLPMSIAPAEDCTGCPFIYSENPCMKYGMENSDHDQC